MNDGQRERLAALAGAWRSVKSGLTSTSPVQMRREAFLRLEAAVREVNANAGGADPRLVATGRAGTATEYTMYSFGLAGSDGYWDAEQSISFSIDDQLRVVANRLVVTRRLDGDSRYGPEIIEGEVSAVEATQGWFIDRLLDFISAKVADPAPSGLSART